ncbi:hypothetical protein ACH40E_39850 [Streptomyces acidicola]|uniref:hypothetical protein n=1 Tax=Streptomyces acidicola TaxID=2596892 RepID=UPI00378FB132
MLTVPKSARRAARSKSWPSIDGSSAPEPGLRQSHVWHRPYAQKVSHSQFGFFAAIAETERENIRESTLETAARKGKHGGRPPVITDDILHTVLRHKALGESVEQIQRPA